MFDAYLSEDKVESTQINSKVVNYFHDRNSATWGLEGEGHHFNQDKKFFTVFSITF